MEGIISSIDSFHLVRALSFTPMVEFPREGLYVHMALFFSALAFCFWGWWRKYAQSLFLFSVSSCFSFKFNTTGHQIRVTTTVPAVMFSVDRVSDPAKQKIEGGKRGKIYMRFECSIRNPNQEDELCRKSEGLECDELSVNSFPVHFRENGDLQELVKCFDVSWRREILAGRRLERNNTVRLWDIPTSRSVNCMKLDESSVIAGARFSNSSHLNLLSGIGTEKQKSRLYVWDTRNFPKPQSFSLGKNSRLDIVEFDDLKIYVCDGLSEQVFDLRMGGAGVVDVVHRRAHSRNRRSLQDFGICGSSVLQ